MPVSASFLNCNYCAGLIHGGSALFLPSCRAALPRADYSQSDKFCKRKFDESSRELRQQDVASQRPLMVCEVLIMCVTASPADCLIGCWPKSRALLGTDDMLVELHHVKRCYGYVWRGGAARPTSAQDFRLNGSYFNPFKRKRKMRLITAASFSTASPRETPVARGQHFWTFALLTLRLKAFGFHMAVLNGLFCSKDMI